MKIKTQLYLMLIILIMVGCEPNMTVTTTEEHRTTRPNQETPNLTVFTRFPTETNVPQETESINYLHNQTPMTTMQISATPTKEDIFPKLVPEEFRKYIGIIYPPLPIDVKDGGFGMIINSENKTIEYSLHSFYKDNIHMIWFNKLNRTDSQGNCWQVLDILALPKPGNDEVFIPSGCMFNGKLDDELVAIGVLDEKSFISRYLPNDHIKNVWRANRGAEVFQQLPTNGVECYADQAMTW